MWHVCHITGSLALSTQCTVFDRDAHCQAGLPRSWQSQQKRWKACGQAFHRRQHSLLCWPAVCRLDGHTVSQWSMGVVDSIMVTPPSAGMKCRSKGALVSLSSLIRHSCPFCWIYNVHLHKFLSETSGCSLPVVTS